MLDSFKTPDDLADAYVHQLLSPEQVTAFEARCEEDETLRQALADAQQRQALLQSVPATEASERLIAQTLGNIEGKIQRRAKGWRRFTQVATGMAVAATLLISVAHIYYLNLRPSPYDVRILGQNELLSGTDAAMRVAVFNQLTGERVSGVPVTLTLLNHQTGDQVEVANFTTDDESSGLLKLPEWEDGTYDLRVVARPEGKRETFTQQLRITRQWKLMLSSDKPIYKPGQTIHLRSLALRKPDLKPVAGESVVFRVSDPKGNVIFKHEATGSRFGIASVDCVLASELIEGPYNIQCSIGDTTSEKTVKVDKYVLPKFQLAITLDKPFYQPGEQVQGTLQADYFFGQPVSGGDVKIEVRSNDVRSFDIASIAATTDDKGHATFQFKLPNKLFGREQQQGDAQFSLVAQVTDSAGQKHSRGTKRIVTARPIKLEIVPELGHLVPDAVNKVYVFANYVDGRPALVDIAFNGGADAAKTNNLGVAVLKIYPQSNELGITLVAKDKQGRVGRKHQTLVVGQVANDFIVRTDKASYAGGETITLTALGGGVEPLFVDFIKDGQTLLTTTVDVTDGQGQHQFDLPPEMFGTIELVAYRFDKSALPVSKTKMIFVRQARQLQITATLDKEEYRPGTTAQLRLKLTDKEGQPTAGAISLSAVDEAVFSVLGQRPGMEEVFFLLNEELLEPAYTIYNWDPFADEVLPPEEVVRWEQALFSIVNNARQHLTSTPQRLTDAIEESDQFLYAQSPHTLSERSFPDKQRRVSRQRRRGTQGSQAAWFFLAVFVVGSVVVWSSFNVRYFVHGLAAFAVLMLVTACLLPAVSYVASPTSGADWAMVADDASAGDSAAGWDMEMPTESTTSDFDPSDPLSPDNTARPRVRQWFPETLLWRPEIITDDNGEVTLEIPLADSISAWRVTTSAVSSEGQLGGEQFPIRVFQPFFVDLDLPVALTRHDQVSVPVVVHNYLDKPQDVEITLQDADWFTRLDANEPLTLKLAPREQRSLTIPLRVERVGLKQLQVSAIGSGISDAIQREIEVVPNGRRVEQIVSGTLYEPTELTMSLPADHIEGSARAIVKLYPSAFSQLVEGLDNIYRMPHGCFEQTSSTTYPNVLALDYLRRTKQSVPEVEAKARQYIHAGYQRLITFEVAGGGFEIFGHAPADQTLTAYGLMEFEDMARVHDVDSQLIARTRQWLLSQRQRDGSWNADSRHRLPNEEAELATTAYIAWAVFGKGNTAQADVTLDYLLAHEPASISSPYVLAIVANCIACIDPNHSSLLEYMSLLDGMKTISDDGKQAFWKQSDDEQTMFYGRGNGGEIETTAMATLALMKAGQYSASVKQALTWIVAQKDGNGTWHSTQATVLALKALIDATDRSLDEDKARKIDIELNNKIVRTIDITVDQAEVMQQIDLSDLLIAGEQALTVTDRTEAGTGFQISMWYHVDDGMSPVEEGEPMSIDIVYDREKLQVNDTVTATATVVNNMDILAPMVMVDLPIPGGFKIEPSELDAMVVSKTIAKYQITARQAILYLRGLEPGQPLQLTYRLTATMPVKVAVPPAVVYEYYTPENRAESKRGELEAVAR